MSLIIRFAKTGRKGERKYRLVVREKRSKREGEPLETLGYYEKSTKDVKKEIDQKRVDYWISKGAKVSPAVDNKLYSNKYAKQNGTAA